MRHDATVVQVIDDFLWVLRREGFVVQPQQAVDAVRAVDAVGLDHPWAVREAIACVVVDHPRDRPRYDAEFVAFFSQNKSERSKSLWERLGALGFDPTEVAALRAAVEEIVRHDEAASGPLSVALGRASEFDWALATAPVGREMDARSELRLGWYTHGLLRGLGVHDARRALSRLRAVLVQTLGGRGAQLADAVAAELDRLEEKARSHVDRLHERRVRELDTARREHSISDVPFAALGEADSARLHRAVSAFGERLRGALRVRRRRAKMGTIDPHGTWRASLRAGGVPFKLVRRERRRKAPKLVVLCDISDSVRQAARFLLELTRCLQEVFEGTRTFVFVSDLGETTALFRDEPRASAVDQALRGAGKVRTNDNSNYGRALRSFEATMMKQLDRRTVVAILGDGRTNYRDAAPGVLDRIRARAQSLWWLCPEPRGEWSSGDSAMIAYAKKCTHVLEVATVADLELAVQRLARAAT